MSRPVPRLPVPSRPAASWTPVPGLPLPPGRVSAPRRPGRLPSWPSPVPRPGGSPHEGPVWVARRQCWAAQHARRLGPSQGIFAGGPRSRRRAWRPPRSGRRSWRSARASMHAPARRSGRPWVRHARTPLQAAQPRPAMSGSGSLAGLQRQGAPARVAAAVSSAARPRSGPAARVLHRGARQGPPPGGQTGAPQTGHRAAGTARGP